MMRRFFLSILVSAGCVTMQAAEVNQQKAQETAKAFMTQMMSQQAGTRRAKDGISLKTVETGLKGLHVFNMDGDNGFVIVSGSDQTEAVLGYATEGSIDGEMPPAMRALLQSYAAQITKAEQGADKAEGESTGIFLTKQEVAPLIKSKWGQDAPYNNMTPTARTKDKKTIHCPTGCVATAAAMVMRYHEWPKQQTAVIPASSNLPELPATTFDWAGGHADEVLRRGIQDGVLCGCVGIELEPCGLRLDTLLRLRQPEHPHDATDAGDGMGMAEHDL